MKKDNELQIINSDAAVGFIIDENERLLLQKKDDSYPWEIGDWNFFGGKIEKDEKGKEIESIKREIYEELNIKLDNWIYAGKIPYKQKNKFKNLIREGNLWIYIGKFIGKIENIKLKEGIGFCFFKKEEIEKMNLTNYHKKAISEIFNAIEQKRVFPI